MTSEAKVLHSLRESSRQGLRLECAPDIYVKTALQDVCYWCPQALHVPQRKAATWSSERGWEMI